MPNEPLLIVDNVHAAYIKKEILRGVSFSIDRGEILALLGGNGSGKSTMLKTIAGLLKPTTGQILLDGEDISSKSIHARQQLGIGYLLQGGRVFPNLTVAENFEMAIKHGRSRDSLDGRAHLGYVFSELKDRASDRAGLLSGGQRQMLAIEMILAQMPRLALLDEPTGALSPFLACGILNRIGEYAEHSGCAVLLVEQNVKEAVRVSHRCLRLIDGVIKQVNKNKEI